MRTYGVAITVPEPFGSALQEHRASFGDPLAGSIPPHVTLLPPTVLARGSQGDLEQHLAAIAATTPAFPMVLSSTGTFRPTSPVVFVQVSQGISSCERLERAIRSGPVERDLEFPYHPHVTVAHHLPEAALDTAYAELAGFRAEFLVDTIDLYAHGDDSVWRPLTTFALAGA